MTSSPIPRGQSDYCPVDDQRPAELTTEDLHMVAEAFGYSSVSELVRGRFPNLGTKRAAAKRVNRADLYSERAHDDRSHISGRGIMAGEPNPTTIQRTGRQLSLVELAALDPDALLANAGPALRAAIRRHTSGSSQNDAGSFNSHLYLSDPAVTSAEDALLKILLQLGAQQPRADSDISEL